MNTKFPNLGGSNASGNDSKYFQTTKKGAPRRRREARSDGREEEQQEGAHNSDRSERHTRRETAEVIERLTAEGDSRIYFDAAPAYHTQDRNEQIF